MCLGVAGAIWLAERPVEYAQEAESHWTTDDMRASLEGGALDGCTTDQSARPIEAGSQFDAHSVLRRIWKLSPMQEYS